MGAEKPPEPEPVSVVPESVTEKEKEVSPLASAAGRNCSPWRSVREMDCPRLTGVTPSASRSVPAEGSGTAVMA